MYYLPIFDEVLNNGLEKKITVWESRLKTFIEFRKHRKHAELVQLSKTQAGDVHEQCSKDYSNEKMIASHLNKVEQGMSKSKDVLMRQILL